MTQETIYVIVAVSDTEAGAEAARTALKASRDEELVGIRASIADLHRRMDDGELEEITDLNTAMASLEIEHGALDRIPTWPWEPERVRLLITALALLLGLWILQYALQLLLGS